MLHSEFKIGTSFRCGSRRWLCTDVGTRTIVAVCLTACRDNDWLRGLPEEMQDRIWEEKNEKETPGMPSVDPSWLEGPPYALAEYVFDENDMKGCTLA